MNFTNNIESFIVPLAFIAGGTLAGIIGEKVILRRLRTLTLRTPWEGDDVIVTSLKGVTFYAFFIAGVYGALLRTPLTEKTREVADKSILVLLLLLATVLLVRLAAGFVTLYAKKAVLPSTSIFTNLAKAIAFTIGMLIILQSMGISIAPLLTALGVGGLAVALALQDTLSNLFSGLHIIATRQIRPGDYIRLSSSEEGYVTDISWRNTVIRTLPNNTVIVPNSKLAGAIVTNFHLPDTEMAVLLDVGVSYDSDLEHVEKVTIDVARDLLREVKGGVSTFEPFIRYNAFSDFSINFTVILRGCEYVDQYLIKHEFVKRLHRRYLSEGIEIPFPIRTVRLQHEPASTIQGETS